MSLKLFVIKHDELKMDPIYFRMKELTKTIGINAFSCDLCKDVRHRPN